MNKEICIAIIDSGCAFKTHEKVGVKKAFQQMEISIQTPLISQHGNTIGEIITENPKVKIIDIQIFDEKLKTTPQHLLKALQYLKNKKVDMIHMSLGLNSNYEEIHDLCATYYKKGVVLVASYPRSSMHQTFPASYESVLAVTSDGRCKNDEIVCLKHTPLLFAANPTSHHECVAGSSVAAARFTKVFSIYLSQGYSKDEIIEKIKKGSF